MKKGRSCNLKAEIYFYDPVTPWSRSCLDGLVFIYFIYGSPTVVGVAKQYKKKRWRWTKLRRWSYLYIKVVCLTFFCLDFLKVTEK